LQQLQESFASRPTLKVRIAAYFLLQALCHDCPENRRLYLPLTASNRMGRESLLLTVGIANYTGKTGDLDATTTMMTMMMIMTQTN
jgi:hypothetical protein